MPVSTINICNMALAKIGQPQITAIEENSQSARQCRIHLELDRDAVMSSFPWTFATNIERAVQVLNETPAPGYSFTYKKPPDALRIIRLVNPAASLSRVSEYDAQTESYREIISGDKILIYSNIHGALIEYIRRVSDPTLWDALFCDALVLKLAMSLYSALTGRGQRTGELNALYEQALSRAKQVNANNDSTVHRMPTTLRDSRR